VVRSLGTVPRFELTTHIAATPTRVFDACLDVEVHTASMAASGERALGAKNGSGHLALGDRVTFEAKHLGLKWRMTAHVSAYTRPEYFADEQERGPFKRWHHAHHFTPDGHGGTLMRDVVEFDAPLGPLGTLAEKLVLHRYMARLLERRNAYVKELVESG
jgi:ligand-binding SRPBCC domain-containing protein